MSKTYTNPVTGNSYRVSGDKNKASLAAAFETNATNYKMFQEQNEFNVNMYEHPHVDAHTYLH